MLILLIFLLHMHTILQYAVTDWETINYCDFLWYLCNIAVQICYVNNCKINWSPILVIIHSRHNLAKFSTAWIRPLWISAENFWNPVEIPEKFGCDWISIFAIRQLSIHRLTCNHCLVGVSINWCTWKWLSSAECENCWLAANGRLFSPQASVFCLQFLVLSI